jgi:DNA-binding beta-propeller fold protein YncE
VSRRTGLLLAALCIAAGFLGAASSHASAAHIDHQHEGSFDGGDAPGGPFGLVLGVATDDSGDPGDGDVYVANITEGLGAGKVFKFDEDGRYAGVALDGSNTPQGSFNFLSEEAIAENGIAVDDSAGPDAGDLYVADTGHGVIDKFSESGQYLCQITGAATPSASECNWPAGSLTPNGGFAPSGIAVDPATGVLYVTDLVHNAIDKFTAAGAFAGQISDPHLREPTEIAVDSSGALYVANGSVFSGENVVKFDPAGNFVSVLDEEEPTGFAVDRSSGDVYVAHGFQATTLTKYASSGAEIESFETQEEGFTIGIAVSATSGRVYGGLNLFAETGLRSSIYMLSPDTIVPEVTAGAPTDIGETAATLHGEVIPAAEAGDAVSCRFEYGTTSSYGHSVPCSPAPPYGGATAVNAIPGLEPSATYHFRLAAANAPVSPYTKAIPGRSGDGTFSTIGHPTVEEESTEDVERTFATLQAKLNPHGVETEFKFEYVDAKHFEEEGGFASPATRSTRFSQIGAALHPFAVNQSAGGLEASTTYHFRAVAVNTHGEGTGPDQTFTTLPVATIGREWAYARLTSATPEARINPLGFDTSCRVQYVADAEFQLSGYANAASEPCAADLGSGNADVVGSATIDGLELSTTYHFRFVVTNKSGTLPGSDQTFTTFGIEDFSMEILDEEGHPYTQAGGHPYEKIIRYHFNHNIAPGPLGNQETIDAFLKDTLTEQPPGQTTVRAEAVNKCPIAEAAEGRCPAESQVGTVTAEAVLENGNQGTETKPVYEVVAPEGVATRYATLNPYTPSDTSVRTASDYGTTSRASNLSGESRVIGLTILIWGIPGDHIAAGTHSSILRNPTNCDGPQTGRLRVDTWEDPGQFVTASTQLPANTGCDAVEFHPSIEWQPTSSVADSPTGLHVDIHQAQVTGAHELSRADLSDVLMNPAKELVFNPAGAAGLAGCSSAQFGIHDEGPAHCPDGAKIGTVEINTPVLNHPLLGGIYMAKPHDNPFDSTFAIYLAVADPGSGVVVKLAGEIQTNPHDGQLTAAFSENPQMPVEDFKLDFFAGPRSLLRTPLTCGTFPTESSLTPWSAPQSGPPAHPSDSYKIVSAPNGGHCVADEAEAPNSPTLRAGTVNPAAGSYSPFVIRLHREDGSQQIADFAVTPPPGLLGHLAGIPRCPDDAVAAAALRTGTEERAMPSCPAGSRVGTIAAEAGAGSDPFRETGNMYVGGPYRGAPLSLVAIVPVLPGPFDFGTVVVRTPLRVNLETGQVNVQSDPIPTILEGVPLDIRTIEVKLDRPGFTVNPTSCEPSTTTAAVTAMSGATAQLSNPFRAGRCQKLGFAPKVQLRLLGHHRRHSHPALHAVLTMPQGGANIAQVTAAMPPTEFLDNNHIRAICAPQQFLEQQCPADSVYGYAKAWSPLLDEPLAGPIYMRSAHHGLPELVADLNGEFHLALAGRIGAAGNGGIGADISGVPDVPVSRFEMTLFGQDRGLLQNSVDICSHPEHGLIKLKAQNGRLAVLHPRIRAQCPKAGR